MKVLTAALSISLSVCLAVMGFKIFSKIHCRQESWHGSFKTITNKVIGSKKLSRGSCQDKSYKLEINIGEEV